MTTGTKPRANEGGIELRMRTAVPYYCREKNIDFNIELQKSDEEFLVQVILTQTAEHFL
jgi:hypothetical protein